MNNFGEYITPEEAILRGETEPLKELLARVKRGAGTCDVCDEKEWLFGGTGLCFSCTTGESDASDDLELR